MLTGDPEHGHVRRLGQALARRISILFLTVITVTIVSAALMRVAPGFGMDERQLDLRLSNERVAGLQQENQSPGISSEFEEFPRRSSARKLGRIAFAASADPGIVR